MKTETKETKKTVEDKKLFGSMASNMSKLYSNSKAKLKASIKANKLLRKIKKSSGGMIGKMMLGLTAVTSAIGLMSSTIGTAIGGTAIGGTLATGAKKVWGGVKTAGSAVGNGLKAVGTNALNGVKTVGSAVGNVVSKGASSLWSGAKSLWGGVKSVGGAVGNGLKTAGSATWNGAKAVGGFASKHAGKVAKGIPLLGTGLAAYDTYTDMQSDEFDDRNTTEKMVIGGSKLAGGLGGALAGAAVGQALIPIPVVGALIGGAIGYWGGDTIGEWLGETVADNVDLGDKVKKDNNLKTKGETKAENAIKVKAKSEKRDEIIDEVKKESGIFEGEDWYKVLGGMGKGFTYIIDSIKSGYDWITGDDGVKRTSASIAMDGYEKQFPNVLREKKTDIQDEFSMVGSSAITSNDRYASKAGDYISKIKPDLNFNKMIDDTKEALDLSNNKMTVIRQEVRKQSNDNRDYNGSVNNYTTNNSSSNVVNNNKASMDDILTSAMIMGA